MISTLISNDPQHTPVVLIRLHLIGKTIFGKSFLIHPFVLMEVFLLDTKDKVTELSKKCTLKWLSKIVGNHYFLGRTVNDTNVFLFNSVCNEEIPLPQENRLQHSTLSILI